jgi:hypothetical protein
MMNAQNYMYQSKSYLIYEDFERMNYFKKYIIGVVHVVG